MRFIKVVKWTMELKGLNSSWRCSSNYINWLFQICQTWKASSTVNEKSTGFHPNFLRQTVFWFGSNAIYQIAWRRLRLCDEPTVQNTTTRMVPEMHLMVFVASCWLTVPSSADETCCSQAQALPFWSSWNHQLTAKSSFLAFPRQPACLTLS